MNNFFISKYINSITLNNINDFAKKEGIFLTNNEDKIIYNYIKKYWKVFLYDNPDNIFNKLKCEVSNNTYNKIIEVYNKYKNKIN